MNRAPENVRMDSELGPMRLCPECREEWPDDEEFFHKSSRRGLCRACQRERRRRSRSTPESMERERARKRKQRLDPERGAVLRARERISALSFYYRRKAA